MQNITNEKEYKERLIKVTKEIKKLYDAMIPIIKNKSILSEEFKECLKELEKVLKEESKIYDEILENPSYLNSLIYEINDLEEEEVINCDIVSELSLYDSEEEEELIKRRITNRLGELLFKNTDIILKSDEDKDINSLRMISHLNDDFITTLVYILYSYIKDEKYQNIKNNLYDILFNIIFLHKNIEASEVALKFNPLDKLYWDAPYLCSCYDISREDYEELCSEFGNNIFDEVFYDLISTDDIELEDKDILKDYILKEAISRCSLLFLREEEVKEIHDNIQLEIFNENIIVEGEKYPDIVDRARERKEKVFRYHEEDKTKVRFTQEEFLEEESQREINLTEEDYQNLEKLFKITKDIKDTYTYLSKLESKDLKNSEDYTLGIKKLQNLLILENKLYEIICEDINVVSDMLYFILKDDTYNIEDIFMNIKDSEEDELIKDRIIFKLNYLVNTMEIPEEDMEEFINSTLEEVDEDEYEELSEEEIEYYSNLSEEDFNEGEKHLLYETKLNYLLFKDIVSSVLRILKDYLKDKNNAEIKDILLRVKYDMSFAFPDVENELLEDNFIISDNLFISSKLFVDLNKGDISDYKDLKNSVTGNILFTLIEPLCDLLEWNMQEAEVYAEGIILEIMIRAGLLFTDELVSGLFKDELEECLKEIKEAGNNNAEVETFIQNIFAHPKDMELPLTLSLKL